MSSLTREQVKDLARRVKVGESGAREVLFDHLMESSALFRRAFDNAESWYQEHPSRHYAVIFSPRKTPRRVESVFQNYDPHIFGEVFVLEKMARYSWADFLKRVRKQIEFGRGAIVMWVGGLRRKGDTRP